MLNAHIYVIIITSIVIYKLFSSYYVILFNSSTHPVRKNLSFFFPRRKLRLREVPLLNLTNIQSILSILFYFPSEIIGKNAL